MNSRSLFSCHFTTIQIVSSSHLFLAEMLLHFCAFKVGPRQSFFLTVTNDQRPTGMENLLVAGDRRPTTCKATSFQLLSDGLSALFFREIG